MATTMYHTRKNPLRKVTEDSEIVETARSGKIRRTHKAFLRYQDPENWPILREALVAMGRGDLIGNGDKHLIPSWSAGEADSKPHTDGRRGPASALPLPPAARGGKSGVVAAAQSQQQQGQRANALTGSLTARQSLETKVRASILDTIKVKKPAAAPPAKGGKPARSAPAPRGRK